MRTVTSLMHIDTLKLIYFTYFHSVMLYGVIFREIQQTEKKKVFVVDNMVNFQANPHTHARTHTQSIKAKSKHGIHFLDANVTRYQKGSLQDSNYSVIYH